MSVSRREFLALVGTAFAGAAAVPALATLGRPSSASTEPATGTDPASEADPTSESARGGQWIVDQIGAVNKGAVPVLLRHDPSGELLRVEVCRKGSANAVASSRHFDLFLANTGRGSAPTPRHHVLAARALAAHLDRHVRAMPAALQTQEARMASQVALHQCNDDEVNV